MTEKMRSFIAKNNLIAPHQRIGAAVSGGADSMAMLHALRELGYEVCVLHFEHGIRPREESAGDMRFVEQYCSERGIAFYCQRAHVPRSLLQGESMEAGARRLRYDFFARMAEEHELDLIATAHHADDAAETFFLHLLRGGGTAGLTGIPVKRDNIIRPLLFAKRAEIEEYCNIHNIPFVTDSTNLSPDCTRNYLRLEVLPKLSAVNPEYTAALLRAQDILREDNAALEEYTEAELCRRAEFSQDRAVLSLDGFTELPLGMQRRILRSALSRICPLTDIEKNHYDALLELCRNARTGTKFLLPEKFSAIVSYNTLILSQKMYKINRMGDRSSGSIGGQLLCAPAEEVCFGSSADLVQFLDGQAMEGAVLRTRKTGDRFHPLGAAGSKKLKDWFIDQKIPAELRDGIPLLAKGSDILWVVGYGISQQAKVRGDSRSVMKCEFKIQ